MDGQNRNSHRGDESTAAIIYNAIIIVLDFCFLFIKYWVKCFMALIEFIRGTPERDVSNDIVLITGTGHGIGKELALQYSALGATIICWDINESMNVETVKTIKSNGGKAHGYTVDVTNREKVLETANKVQNEVGDVTILVNNAGIMPQHSILKHTETEIRKCFEINALAHCWMFQSFLPRMIEKNHGHIVALSSIAGLIGFNNLVPYCGSKYAVRGMMEAMAEELRQTFNGKCNIKFTTIMPYMVDTGLCKNVRIRFENFLGLLKPSYVAKSIISAQRRGLLELTVPRYLYFLNIFLRVFPYEAALYVRDFFDSSIESDI